MIVITGDTHGSIDIKKLNSDNFPKGKELTRDDYVIILGDFGLLWRNKPDETEKYWTKWYNEKPWTTLFIDGNHENFKRINELPLIDKFGAKVGQVSDNIFHLRRGQVYDINDTIIFTMGGAESIDKQSRIIDISWWPEELPNYAELQDGIDNLARHDNHVDFILTHTCSTSIFEKLSKIVRQGSDAYYKYDLEVGLRKYFDEINNKIQFQDWFFGHFHEDVPGIDGRYHAVYNKLITIS